MQLSAVSSIKDRLTAGDPTLKPAFDQMINDANVALKSPQLSVTFRKLTPPSGDKRDYMSLATYWWPDPPKPDGLPYIKRDGQTNSDRPNLGSGLLPHR